jgi:hypothetical protein
MEAMKSFAVFGVPVWIIIVGIVLAGFMFGWWAKAWAWIQTKKGGTVINTTIDARISALIMAIGVNSKHAQAAVLKAELTAAGDTASAALVDPLIVSIDSFAGTKA